ncbi:uncharacterized protein YjbI with pentapeptide repeats [Brevundimonas sp. 1080]|uniref:pentapeptide repeat-containing protein n=1 Tax=Brevundimonas sp. 1080 TaxID=3156405 RepID=UPI003398BB4D
MKSDSIADLRAEWWRRWWRQDYSWNGLANIRVAGWFLTPDDQFTRNRRQVGGTRPATLQDIWREEEHRLETAPNGQEYTRVHTPLVWQDGSPAKSAWMWEEQDAIDRSIDAALKRFPKELPVSTERSGGKPPRFLSYTTAPGLPMDGAILDVLPDIWLSEACIKGQRLYLGEGRLRGRALKNLHLRRVFVDDDFALAGVTEGMDLRLSSGVVAGAMTFANIDAGRLQCARLTCADAVSAEAITCPGGVSFNGDDFRDEVQFDGITTRQLTLEESRIADDLRISNVQGDLSLESVKIGGALSVSGFEGEQLEGDYMSVERDADFSLVKTGLSTSFTETRWGRALSFAEATLSMPMFHGAEFGGKVGFDDVTFQNLVSFARAHFQGPADFRNVIWEGVGGDHEGAFKETRFDSFVDFRGIAFTAFSAFNGAMFKGEIRFDRDLVTNDRRMIPIIRAADTDEERLGLEHGFRALKQAAEGVRDRYLEQALFRYELVSRRQQTTTPSVERSLSWLFGLCSNYGASFRRPVAAALALWAFGACVYFGLAAMTGTESLQYSVTPAWPHRAWIEAANLSSRSMVNLFGIWNLKPLGSGEPTSVAQAMEYALLRDSPGFALATRLISSVQSFLAGVLLFLVALAARRRFQIN